jgi:hypothetical protein
MTVSLVVPETEPTRKQMAKVKQKMRAKILVMVGVGKLDSSQQRKKPREGDLMSPVIVSCTSDRGPRILSLQPSSDLAMLSPIGAEGRLSATDGRGSLVAPPGLPFELAFWLVSTVMACTRSGTALDCLIKHSRSRSSQKVYIESYIE